MPLVNFDDLLLQADRLRDSAKTDESVRAYLDITRLASEQHETSYRARAFHMAGVAAMGAVTGKQSSYYRDAKTLYSEAEKLYLQLGDKTGLGSLYRDMGVNADYASDYLNALPYFQKSIALLEVERAYGELAITYDKLGVHFYRLNKLEQAKQHIEKALRLFRQEPTQGFLRATTLLDLSRVLVRLGQLDEAYEQATESLGWFEAEHPGSSYTRRRCQLYGLLTVILSSMHRIKEARRYSLLFEELLAQVDPYSAQVLKAEVQAVAS